MANQRVRPPLGMNTLLRTRIRQPQFYWFLGHVMILYHFIQFHLSIFNGSNQKYHYNRSLIYVLITYGIVLYQFIRSKQLNVSNYMMNLYKMDNLQYFTLYLTLYVLNVMSSGKILLNGGMLSPTIFALFHVLNYFKENLLPSLTMIPQRIMIGSLITGFIRQYNEKCLLVAQSWEIILMFRYLFMSLPTTVGKLIIVLLFQQRLDFVSMGKLIMIIVYCRFIRWRYVANQPFSRMFNGMLQKIDMMVPAPYVSVWSELKQIVIKYLI